MDRATIAKIARQAETKEDLLALLNQLKRDDMVGRGREAAFYPFTMRHLDYYCNPNNAFHRYKQFAIRKKSGGKRQITAPRNASFKLLLHYVNEILKALYTPSAYAMGFAEGRSVVTNAGIHLGQNYVFNIDLKDFFPSVHQARVWRRLQLEPLCLKAPMANIVAGLCAMRERTDDGEARYILPQGAPTSPILTNMVCDRLDRRLAGLARRFGLRYSRYADDITFSSMHNVYRQDGAFRVELRRIIQDQGFAINEGKTRLQKTGSRQEVTGIVVNSKLNVSQKYVRDLRNILYIWDKCGYDTAFNKFFFKYRKEKGHVKRGNPDMVNVLDGKLMYLKMVKGDSDSVYLRLKAKFDALVQSLSDSNNTTAYGVTYVETTPVLEFERKNKTEIVITTFNPTDVYRPSAPRRYAHFMLGGKRQKASVNKWLKPQDEARKELLSISHCRDVYGSPFWLVHRSDKVTVPPARPVDIDKLNNDLDDLLK